MKEVMSQLLNSEKNCRLSKEACRELIVELTPFMPARRKNTSIARELQVNIFLILLYITLF